jgi:hypothetical protein
MMKLYYLVAVDVDRAAIMADNPPEDIKQSIAWEIASHLRDSSVQHALGVRTAEVEADADVVVRNLRSALHSYAHPTEGWEEAAHADAYEASKESVPLDADEREQERQDHITALDREAREVKCHDDKPEHRFTVRLNGRECIRCGYLQVGDFS